MITTLQLLASLSILVVLHECGHFFPAKWFKTKVEKFYLFFDPWFSLFKYKKGETEYGIGWLPLGGYVKIAGMIDESFDKEQMQGPPQPWEFRSKPAWQRLIIMLGGVIVNFILGIFLFAMVFYNWGEKHIVNESLPYGIHVDSLAYDMGLREGDHIKRIGEKELKRFSRAALTTGIVIEGAKEIEVVRNGSNKILPIDPRFVQVLSSYDNKDASLISARLNTKIKSVADDSPAQAAGIRAGDRVIAIDNKPAEYIEDVQRNMKGKAEDGPVIVTVLRNDRDTITNKLNLKKGLMGVGWYLGDEQFEWEIQEYDMSAAASRGWSESKNFLRGQMIAFGKMFKGEIKAKDSLGSFISIGKMFGDTWNWHRFWRMTAMLSILLGFLNLLPIPALDGGHVMFLLWEVFTGRKPSDKVIEYATLIGFILLMGLMIYAIGLDIWRNI